MCRTYVIPTTEAVKRGIWPLIIRPRLTREVYVASWYKAHVYGASLLPNCSHLPNGFPSAVLTTDSCSKAIAAAERGQNMPGLQLMVRLAISGENHYYQKVIDSQTGLRVDFSFLIPNVRVQRMILRNVMAIFSGQPLIYRVLGENGSQFLGGAPAEERHFLFFRRNMHHQYLISTVVSNRAEALMLKDLLSTTRGVADVITFVEATPFRN